MSRLTEQIDHGPEVVRESYHPTLEAVNHSQPHSVLNNPYISPVSAPPYNSPVPYTNDKASNHSGANNQADTKSTLDILQDKQSREHPDPNRRPFGLSTFAFGIVIALITAIVVGGAVGGGIGAVVAMKNNDLTKANEALIFAQSTIQSLNQTQASNTTQVPDQTATSTNCTSTNVTDVGDVTTKVNLANYTVEPAIQVENLFLDCPNIASSLFTTSQNEKFSLYCRSAFVSGLEASQGGVVADMIHIVAYSAEDCMEACSGFNYEQRKWNGTARCRAMNFRANMAEKVQAIGGNCWLKNDTVKDVGAAPVADGVVSGHIVE